MCPSTCIYIQCTAHVYCGGGTGDCVRMYVYMHTIYKLLLLWAGVHFAMTMKKKGRGKARQSYGVLPALNMDVHCTTRRMHPLQPTCLHARPPTHSMPSTVRMEEKNYINQRSQRLLIFQLNCCCHDVRTYMYCTSHIYQ